MSNGARTDRTTEAWERRIERDTERLRDGVEPELGRIRELVAARGVDIGTSLVANLMPEDTGLLSGLIVDADGGVHEFEYGWRHVQADQGRLTVWRDVTDSYESRAFREPIAVAVALARRTAPAATA